MDLDLDSLKNILQVLSYSNPNKEGMSKMDKVVDAALAQSCIDDYKKLYQSTANGDIKNAYTEWVSFGSPELVKWLAGVCAPGDTDTNNLRICFGVYNDNMLRAYAEIDQRHLHRLTVFIWPYCDNRKATYLKRSSFGPGDGVQPYNIGSLYP